MKKIGEWLFGKSQEMAIERFTAQLERERETFSIANWKKFLSTNCVDIPLVAHFVCRPFSNFLLSFRLLCSYQQTLFSWKSRFMEQKGILQGGVTLILLISCKLVFSKSPQQNRHQSTGRRVVKSHKERDGGAYTRMKKMRAYKSRPCVSDATFVSKMCTVHVL